MTDGGGRPQVPVTDGRVPARGSALRLRLALAFLSVALAAVALLAGLTAVFAATDVASLAARQHAELTSAIAVAAGAAWDRGDSWASADLSPVLDLAAQAGADVQIRDQHGQVVTSSPGFTTQPGPQASAAIVVRGEPTGQADVRFTGAGLASSTGTTRSSRACMMSVRARTCGASSQTFRPPRARNSPIVVAAVVVRQSRFSYQPICSGVPLGRKSAPNTLRNAGFGVFQPARIAPTMASSSSSWPRNRRPRAYPPYRTRSETRSGCRAAYATAIAAPWDTPSSANRSRPIGRRPLRDRRPTRRPTVRRCWCPRARRLARRSGRTCAARRAAEASGATPGSPVRARDD